MNLEKINVNVISERAQEEHNKTTTKYNQNLMNNEVIEIRRLLVTNTEQDRDTINNMLLPDQIKSYYMQQTLDILSFTLTNLFEN